MLEFRWGPIRTFKAAPLPENVAPAAKAAHALAYAACDSDAPEPNTSPARMAATYFSTWTLIFGFAWAITGWQAVTFLEDSSQRDNSLLFALFGVSFIGAAAGYFIAVFVGWLRIEMGSPPLQCSRLIPWVAAAYSMVLVMLFCLTVPSMQTIANTAFVNPWTLFATWLIGAPLAGSLLILRRASTRSS